MKPDIPITFYIEEKGFPVFVEHVWVEMYNLQLGLLVKLIFFTVVEDNLKPVSVALSGGYLPGRGKVGQVTSELQVTSARSPCLRIKYARHTYINKRAIIDTLHTYVCVTCVKSYRHVTHTGPYHDLTRHMSESWDNTSGDNALRYHDNALQQRIYHVKSIEPHFYEESYKI